ncbi:MAG: uracil-DNA glycosylase family protein, partial [Chloroflexota bacterium]
MSEEQVDAIAAQISTCTLCPLHEGRKNTVPGSGNPDADIMFIGEAPGQYEDEQGVPFVGRAQRACADLCGNCVYLFFT